jgi:hypothetical protein
LLAKKDGKDGKDIHRMPERCRIRIPVSKGNRGTKSTFFSLPILAHNYDYFLMVEKSAF